MNLYEYSRLNYGSANDCDRSWEISDTVRASAKVGVASEIVEGVNENYICSFIWFITLLDPKSFVLHSLLIQPCFANTVHRIHTDKTLNYLTTFSLSLQVCIVFIEIKLKHISVNKTWPGENFVDQAPKFINLTISFNKLWLVKNVDSMSRKPVYYVSNCAAIWNIYPQSKFVIVKVVLLWIYCKVRNMNLMYTQNTNQGASMCKER